jgi:hypothetical protein
MNRFIRQAYGRSGSRLDGVLVCTPPMAATDSTWIRVAMVLFWLLIALFFSRYTQPVTGGKSTVEIDTSKLLEKEKLAEPEMPEQQMKPPVENEQPPPVNVSEPPRATTEKVQETPPVLRPETEKPLRITRPSPATTGIEPPVPARPTRERITASSETTSAPVARIVRETQHRSEQSEVRSDRRMREFIQPVDAGQERLTIRRQPVVDENLSNTTATAQRQILRAQTITDGQANPTARIERKSAAANASVSTVAKNRDREQPTSSVSEGTGSGKVRGVSFHTLDVCPNIRDEEEKIRKVLSILGGRTACGEYSFTGTSRISSFNMLINTAKVRGSSNRCEELENAYNCLKNNR